MALGRKESTQVEDCEKSAISLINSRFQAVEGKNKPTSLKYFRLGKWSQNKVRPIKIVFKSLEEKKVFLSSLHKLKTAGENLKRVHEGHDFSL